MIAIVPIENIQTAIGPVFWYHWQNNDPLAVRKSPVTNPDKFAPDRSTRIRIDTAAMNAPCKLAAILLR